MKTLQIIIDTREQTPWQFPREWRGYQITTQRGTLAFGDYTLAGFEDRVFIERKSGWDEIARNVGADRDRFHREFEKARNCEIKQLIICETREVITMGTLRTRVHPNALWGSVMSFCERYGVFLYDARDHHAGMIHCLGVLRRFMERQDSP